MIGFLDETGENVVVFRVAGARSFISYKQTPKNHFIFPLIEAQSLFSSGKLVILTNGDGENPLRNISMHAFFNHVFLHKINFEMMKRYCVFSRIGTVQTKTLDDQTFDETPYKRKLEKIQPNSYFNIMKSQREKMNKPKFASSSAFPPSYQVKFPDGHGLPHDGYISIDKKLETYNEKKSIIVPLSLRFLIQVNNEPGLNFKFT